MYTFPSPIGDRIAVSQKDSSLTYHACPHSEKYHFVTHSRLRKYLQEECQGWVRDLKDQYTVNYILIVLLANCKEKGLFSKDNPLIIECKGNLEYAFDRRSIHIGEIRTLVLYHLHHREPLFFFRPPFLCPFERTSLIESLVSSQIDPDELYTFICKQA